MSHFTRIRTQMVEKDYITAALQELGHQCEVGELKIRGYGGKKTQVEIKIQTKSKGYEVGFRKAGATYEMVADWYGVRGVNRKQLMQDVSQRYAYHATRAKLEQDENFSLVEEKVDEDGRIHLVLRRMV